jgi:hypothetical protein
MDSRAIPVIFILFLQNYVYCLETAIVKVPLTKAKIGDSTIWSCDSENLPLQLCLWEKISQDEDTNFLISFNPTNTRLDSRKGTDQFTYSGDGLAKGECGLQIKSVTKQDFGKWQCTLFSETKIYRGNVELILSEEKSMAEPSQQLNITNQQAEFRNLKPSEGFITPIMSRGSVSLIIPPEFRDSRQLPPQNKAKSQLINTPQQRQRPVITGPVHSNEPQEISLSSSSTIVGAQVSEVKVESAHLQIKKSKLQTY